MKIRRGAMIRLLWPFTLCAMPGPALLTAQAGPPDSSRTVRTSPLQNVWVSAGVGVGTGGIGVIGSAWYSYAHFVVGAHKTAASGLFGRAVADNALLLGVRNVDRRRHLLIAGGPAKVGGLHHRLENDPSAYVPRWERGGSVTAEAAFTSGIYGIGIDLFAARSKNRAINGATISIQVGWFGN